MDLVEVICLSLLVYFLVIRRDTGRFDGSRLDLAVVDVHSALRDHLEHVVVLFMSQGKEGAELFGSLNLSVTLGVIFFFPDHDAALVTETFKILNGRSDWVALLLSRRKPFRRGLRLLKLVFVTIVVSVAWLELGF